MGFFNYICGTDKFEFNFFRKRPKKDKCLINQSQNNDNYKLKKNASITNRAGSSTNDNSINIRYVTKSNSKVGKNLNYIYVLFYL